MPMITDSRVAISPATKPTTMVALAPLSSWEKMSAPRLLVPSQCAAEGCRFGANALSFGANGAIHGPISVSSANTAMMIRPVMALGERGRCTARSWVLAMTVSGSWPAGSWPADTSETRDMTGGSGELIDEEAIEQFGRLDIVVANAGVLNWGRLWEISAQQWQDAIDTNLTGVWNTIKSTVPAMIAAGNGGSIINISSAAGIKAVPGCGHYCASKFGVVGLTNSLAVELGEFGIRVNSVHPYGTDTPMGNDVAMYQIFADNQTYIHSFSPGALPTDSLAAPDLVSDIVVFLASDASSLITAAQIPADKGYLKI